MSRRITTISLALVMALIGTILVVVYVGRADARALEGVQTVAVLVAKQPLAKGLTVRQAQDAKLLATEQLPKKTVPAGALTAFAPTDAELVFASDVTPGEILQRPRLTTAAAIVKDEGLVIPDGKLALSVALEDPAKVAGFVKPGSQIAVFDSYNVFEGNQGGSWTPSGDRLSEAFPVNKATRILLSRITVLAVGETTAGTPKPTKSEDKGDSAAAAPQLLTTTLLTVAVTQREAEKLVHGIQTGSLYLGLLGKAEVKPGAGVDNRNLFN